MTYLIVQISLFIAVASLIGLMFGWMLRGGASAARVRELRQSLAQAEAEAIDHRREAAELAARAERRTSAGPSPDVARLQGDLRAARERIARMESEAREAGSTIDRYAEEAEELRRRIADLMSRSGGAGADERAAWRARMSELEEEAESLRRRLDQRDTEATQAYEAKIALLEGEGETLRQHLEELRARAIEASEDKARIAELEHEIVGLRQRLEEALDASRAAANARMSEMEAEREVLEQRLRDLDGIVEPLRSRVSELEDALSLAPRERDAARAAAAEEIEALRAEADGLKAELARRDGQSRELEQMRARIGELEADLDLSRSRTAQMEGEAGESWPASASGEDLQSEAARLKWRNSYLTSRIHFLESQLREEEARRGSDAGDADDARRLVAARDEIARLNARVADMEKAAASHDKSDQPAPNVEGGGGSLEWRNRYLASRVRYLEQRLEELSASGASLGDDEVRLKLAQAQEDLKEMAKLRGRLSELERQVEQGDGLDGAVGKSESDRALEWRIRYLSSRVKYLEDRLAKAGVAPEGAEVG
jgi:chromosome segregation ATPase